LTAVSRAHEYKDAVRLALFVDMWTGSQATEIQHASTQPHQIFAYPRPRPWYHLILLRLRWIFRTRSEQSSLPQHNPVNVTEAAPSAVSGQAPKVFHLLACMKSARFGQTLKQDCIDEVDTDRTLFCFLRRQFRSYRGRFAPLLSLRSVKGIHFTRFRLFAGGIVEVRHHSQCCEYECNCLPPQSLVEPSDQAEYNCMIGGPLNSGPPVLPGIMGHFFSNPSCIPKENTAILAFLPRRICGMLQESINEATDGWGIYYEEGWNRGLITMLLFVGFALGSLLFGTLWSYYRLDIQGAFGVSAWLLTACGILISMVAMRAGNI
jgi:hypothetical protein